MAEHPKVFISYSHQNAEYENKILEFANKLRAEGIDANIDLYEESPAEGWRAGWKIKLAPPILC